MKRTRVGSFSGRCTTGQEQQAMGSFQALSLNADKGLKEGLRFGARTKTLLELCERAFHM